jgi:hypothetical protein
VAGQSAEQAELPESTLQCRPIEAAGVSPLSAQIHGPVGGDLIGWYRESLHPEG